MSSAYNYYPGGRFNRFYRVDPVDFYPAGKPITLSRSEVNRQKAIKIREAKARERLRAKQVRMMVAQEMSRRHRELYKAAAVVLGNNPDVLEESAAKKQQYDNGWKDDELSRAMQQYEGSLWC